MGAHIHADTLTIPASADTFAYSTQPTNNFGSVNRLRAGPYADDDTILAGTGAKRAFIKFDLSSLPSGAVITNVAFQAFQTDMSQVSPGGFDVFAIGADWQENSLTWNNQPAAANFIGNMPTIKNSICALTNSAALTQPVKSWYTGASPAYGLAFRVTDEQSTANGDTFASRESTNHPPPELIIQFLARPHLYIRHSQPQQVELSWPSATNQLYQLQYCAAVPANTWSNLGGQQVGNGSTNYVTDPVVDPRRFYRLRTP